MATMKMTVDGVHDYTDESGYQWPEEPAVREHLEWFRGLKLGLMMHWMPSCQIGTFESWPLADDAAAWSQASIDWTDIATFKEQYRKCSETFFPMRFRPDHWAELAEESGFKYLLLTTKHHDGFCMWDTKTTDYRITHPSCPHSQSPYADIIRATYDEFRKRGMAISTYFSKPDWNSPYFWAPEFGPSKVRHPNYDPKEHPEIWEKFVQYTHAQLRELTSAYGKIDVLWLDGGWVSGESIRLEEIVDEIRSTTQPHLIVCNRTGGGRMENIVTPETVVPSRVMNIPWESCIPAGRHFAFFYDEPYKTPTEVIHMLIEIVAKGGNLALNIAPQPNGELPAEAVRIMKTLGGWLKVHGEGIYETIVCAPYCHDNIAYTQKGETVYAFCLLDEGEALPDTLTLQAQNVQKITLLRTGEIVPFSYVDGALRLDCSKLTRDGAAHAECFRLM